MQLPFSVPTKCSTSRSGWSRWSSAGEHHITARGHDNKYVLLALAIVIALAGIAAAVMVYAKQKAKPIEPEILAEAWYYDKGVSAFMGGPGRKAFDACRLVRCEGGRRCRQRHRQARARRRR
jgi:hypothetical protein